MFAKFDENPAETLQDIKKTKRYGRTDARTQTCLQSLMKIQQRLFKILRKQNVTNGCTDNVKTVYPPQTKFAGGIISRQHFKDKNIGRILVDLQEHHSAMNSFPMKN